MGPIQILLLGFEDFRATGGIADELTALSDAGTIRIIDARFLLKCSADEVVAVRLSDLDDSEREDLRVAAGALVGLGAGAVLGGEDGAAAFLLSSAECPLLLGASPNGPESATVGHLTATTGAARRGRYGP